MVNLQNSTNFMIRLTSQSDKNSAEAYDAIFFERAKKGVHWADARRWKTLLKYYKDETNLIDLGCLDSKIPQYMKRANGYYLGVDMAIKAIEAMYRSYQSQVDFRVGDIYNLPKDFENRFDYAVLGEVLEHLEFPDRAVREAFRVLRVGGILAISTPLLEENEPGALDAERHIWSFDTIDIARMIEEAGGTVIDYKILRSKWFPIYKYSWPTIVCWATKK